MYGTKMGNRKEAMGGDTMPMGKKSYYELSPGKRTKRSYKKMNGKMGMMGMKKGKMGY